MSALLIEPHYLGNLAYFNLLIQSDSITLDIHHHYLKQTYRNRCEILTASGVRPLSIPVSFKNHMPYKEVTVDHSQSWARDHWGAISSAYGKTPFFEFYADYFEPLFVKKQVFLLDLSVDFLTVCLKLLKIRKDIHFTEKYLDSESGGFFDQRNRISPKNHLERDQLYKPVTYTQLFGKDFAPNLSVLDLLFCEGPQATDILIKSA
jgi:hypothetical protein